MLSACLFLFIYVSLSVLSHLHDDISLAFPRDRRNDISLQQFPVHGYGYDALLHVSWVFNPDVIPHIAEGALYGISAYRVRNTGIYFETLQGRLDPQNILADRRKGPGRGSGQPAVLPFAECRRVFPATI